MNETVKKKVYLVEDHSVVRQGLAELVNRQSDLCVCGEADEGGKALIEIGQLNPDIALIDLSLKDVSGLDLIKSIRLQFENVLMLVLTMHTESFYAERALKSGAMGYLMKDAPFDEVLLAIREVLAGKQYIDKKLASELVSDKSQVKTPISSLTDRELEVFRMIGKGISTRDIAQKLHLSIKTIETYRENIKKKLSLKNSAELVHEAVQWIELENR